MRPTVHSAESFVSRFDRPDDTSVDDEIPVNAPAHYPPRVLLIGDDPVLQYSRRLVLTHAGYEAESADSSLIVDESLLKGFELAILCHSIPDEVTTHIVTDFTGLARRIPLLLISPLENPDTCRGEITCVQADPASLLNAVAAELGPPSMPESGQRVP